MRTQAEVRALERPRPGSRPRARRAVLTMMAVVAIAAVAAPSRGQPAVPGDGAAAALTVEAAGARRVFVRMETGAQTSVTLRAHGDGPVTAVEGRVELQGRATPFRVERLAPGAGHRVDLAVDSALRIGSYPLIVTVRGRSEGDPVEVSAQDTVVLTARPIPRMPVVMWGGGDVETLTDIGFTHKLLWLQDYRKIWDAGAPTQAVDDSAFAQQAQMLDELAAAGLGGAVYLYPGRWVMRDEELAGRYGRVGRAGAGGDTDAGAIDRDNVCANFPAIRRYAFDVGASVARTFGDFPGLQAALVHSEIRDATRLCFHDHDRDAYRAATGREIPTEAVGKNGVRYSSLPGFPADRIVADDDPLLTYYRWFWKAGDGWNGLHTRVHEGLKSTGRDDLWTFFDPAVRAPSLWGSGGGVDVISQWTYSYPDPIKIGQAADELFAMAAGQPGQEVMKMTQIIWYRSQTAPELPADTTAWAEWEHRIPDARFITIAPDHLREAFWSKLSRPVRGIMYHGWGSLVPAEHGSYRFTNPATRGVLTQLVHDVVQPLGPTLLQVADPPARVALLESFTSQVFAQRGTHGWSGSWEADVHLVLQWAQLQPAIVYEETILRDGLEGVQVLVAPFCDVLPVSVADAIQAFQDRGGILVADEALAPRLVPDILLPSRPRSGRPDQDKAALQALARDLRSQLDPFLQRAVEADDPDVVVRTRRAGGADYVFVVNDRRTFGDYVGHHGRVMEDGVPVTARLTLRRDAGAVYDLVVGKAVSVEPRAEGVSWPVSLGPGGGGLFLVVDAPIAAVTVDAAGAAHRGDRVPVTVTVRDAAGAAVDAVLPVRVEVVDAAGTPSEFGGFYGAAGGTLQLQLDLAANDAPGGWTIRATELASGRTVEHGIEVAE